MISTQDRAGWFGASDTKYIMRDNRTTKSWIQWWETKLGARHENFTNKYTYAGTIFEHPILDAVDDGITKDGQILIEDKKIRVNYDGYKNGVIYEVKTFNAEKGFNFHKEYWMQCQVEMYVYKEMASTWFLPEFQKLELVTYPLEEPDYETDDPVVDPNKIHREIVEYDEKFIKKYLRRVTKLAKYLEDGKFPS